jgi:hypothetical protein
MPLQKRLWMESVACEGTGDHRRVGRALLLEAARKLSAEDRKRVGELLLENLRKPVGELK